MESCSSSTPTSSSYAASSFSSSHSWPSSSTATSSRFRTLLDDEKFTMNPLTNPSIDCKENFTEWERILNEVNIEELSNNDYLYGTCHCFHISEGLLLEEKGLHEEALLIWIQCCNSHHPYGQYKIALRHFYGWFLYLDLFRAKELLFASANKGLIHSICFLFRYPLPLKASERLGRFESVLHEDKDDDDSPYEGTPINSITAPIESSEAKNRRKRLLCEPMSEDEYLTMTTPKSYSPSLDKVALIYLKLSKIDTSIFDKIGVYKSTKLLLEGYVIDYDCLHAFSNLFHYSHPQPSHQVIGGEIRKSAKGLIRSTLRYRNMLGQVALLYLKLLSDKGHMAALNSLLELYQKGHYWDYGDTMIGSTIADHCSLLIKCSESSILAQEKLGYYYLIYGSGLEYNFEKAKYYAKLAAEGGAPRAEENYISMHAIHFPHVYYGNGIYLALACQCKHCEGKPFSYRECDCCQRKEFCIRIYGGRYLPENMTHEGFHYF